MTARRALLFFPHNPSPARTGAHRVLLERIIGLKELGFEVALHSSTLFSDSPWTADAIASLRSDWGVDHVMVHEGDSRDHEWIASRRPGPGEGIRFEQYTPPGLRESFARACHELTPDLVLVHYALWGELAFRSGAEVLLRVMDTYDLVTLNARLRQIVEGELPSTVRSLDEVSPGLLDPARFARLNLQADPEEYRVYDRFDWTIAVSAAESRLIEANAPNTRVQTLPCTVEPVSIQNRFGGRGVLAIADNPFNVQGYLFLARHILPEILRQLPNFAIDVVGDGCSRVPDALGACRRGYVPSLRSLYEEASFAACPLLVGTGQQVKIIEAMAHGVPVVALQNVAESSPIDHGVNGFIAQDGREFAEYAVRLSRDRELCRGMGSRAQDAIRAGFSRSVLIGKLDEITSSGARRPSEAKPLGVESRVGACPEPPRKRILIDGVVFQLQRRGGIPRVWNELLPRLVNGLPECDFFWVSRTGEQPLPDSDRFRNLYLPPANYEDIGAERDRLAQLCTEHRIDLFLSTFYTSPGDVCPSLMILHDMIFELWADLLNRGPNAKFCRAKVDEIEHATAFIAVSECTRRDFLNLTGISPERVRVIPNGVSSTFRPVSAEHVAEFRRRFGLERPFALFVGARGQYKGFRLLLEAYDLQSDPLDIVCVGGEATASAEEEAFLSAHPPGVLRRLEFSGDDLLSAYSATDVMVVAAEYEGFGLPALEAQACGAAVVCSNAASLPEAAGDAALYFQSGSSRKLAEALQAIHDPELRSRLRNRGQERARQFTWERAADRYVDEFRRVLGQDPVDSWPMISVITPSYNQGKFIENTIASVRAQNYPNLEHIVIDGASSDGTAEILNRYPHLRWVSEPDSGQSEALNKGFEMARGEVVAWINSDDWYEPDIFRTVARFFAQHPDKCVLMGDCNLVDEEGRVFDRVTNHARGFEELSSFWVPRSIPTQPAVFFRRHLLDEFGDLDGTLYYAMDYDLWMRFSQRHRFHHQDQVFADYRFHGRAKIGDQDWQKAMPECDSVRRRYVRDRSTPPKVSVIIPCYKYGHYLEAAVRSVLAQTYRDFELIIVNDGSPDDTREVAERLIAEHPEHEIRLINQENAGRPAFGCNRAAAESRGQYIIRLDADDSMAPTLLQECVRVLESESDVAIAYTDQIYFGHEGSWVVETRDYDLRNLLQANFISTCCLIRRAAWEAVGGYDTELPGYEDWELWIRMGRAGLIGRRIPRPLFRYRKHDQGLYAADSRRDSDIKSQIVLRHPDLYDEGTVARARSPRGDLVPVRSAQTGIRAEGRIVAIMSAYNEEDVIDHVIGDLIANGIDVYLIDDGSTDNTVAAANQWLGRGLLRIERFAEESGAPAMTEGKCAWREILRRKEEIAAELGADWVLHVDADEFREGPWPGLTLSDAIRRVDALGYNAITFELLNFRPTDDRFEPGTDVRTHLTHYEPGEVFDALQIKVWKNTGRPVELARNGGHDVRFPERRVFPVPFILRHYPIRGEIHGRRKVFSERLPRFAEEERALGWHCQYDALASGSAEFLHDPASLVPYDRSEVRARLLARGIEELLLLECVDGRNSEFGPLDPKATGAWLAREVGFAEPVGPELVDQIESALDQLYEAVLHNGGKLIDIHLNSRMAQLLSAAARIRVARRRVAGETLEASYWSRIAEALLKGTLARGST